MFAPLQCHFTSDTHAYRLNWKNDQLYENIGQLKQLVTKRHGPDPNRPVFPDSSFQRRGQIVPLLHSSRRIRKGAACRARLDDFAIT